MDENNGRSSEEDRERKVSHYVIYYTQFVIILTFGTVSIGLWPYLNKIDPTASKTFLGYLFAASGFGQTVFSPIIGFCSNKLGSNRMLFIGTILLNVLSLVIHAFVESFSSHRKYWLLLSRFLSGIAAGNITICRSHISSTTLISERTKAISFLSSSAIIALGLGAGIQLITIPFGDFGFFVIPGVNLNMYSAVAWILIILELLNVLLFHRRLFKEHVVIKRMDDGGCSKKETYKVRHFMCLALVFVCFNFITVFNGSFERVLGTPLLMDQSAMRREDAVFVISVLNVIFAACCFVLSLLIAPICKRFSEFRVLIFGLALFVIARWCFYPIISETPLVMDGNLTTGCPVSQVWCTEVGRVFIGQIVAGMFLERIAQTISAILVMVMFSKILASKPQGTWMGYMTASGSLARIIAPIIISRIYSGYGPAVASLSTNLTFTVIALILLKTADYCMFEEETIQHEETEEMNTMKKDSKGIEET